MSVIDQNSGLEKVFREEVNQNGDIIRHYKMDYGGHCEIIFPFPNNSSIIEHTKNNNLEGVVNEIKNGGDVNFKNNFGTTALMEASYDGYFEIVKVLVQAGANSNELNSSDRSSVDLAVLKNNTYVETFFLSLNTK
jgi:ankyrin repeat protein